MNSEPFYYNAKLNDAANAIAVDDRDLVRACLDSALEEASDCPEAWLMKAWVCETLQESEASLQKALEIDPDNELAEAGLSWIQGLKETAELQLEIKRRVEEAEQARIAEEARLAEEARMRAEEEARLKAEQEQARAEEEARIKAEQARKAEEARIAEEEARIAEEARMRAEEESRQKAEQEKADAEDDARIKAEQARQAEEARIADEESRQKAEQEKAQSEKEALLKAEQAEQARIAAEAAAEQERLKAEAELARAEEEARLMAEQNLREQQACEQESIASGDELKSESECQPAIPAIPLAACSDQQEMECSALCESIEDEIIETVDLLAAEVQLELKTAEEISAGLATTASTEKPPVIGAKPVVLAVDDSPTIRKLVSLALAKEGFEVITAEDGIEALSIIAERLPDLILSDINMPKLGGYKLCKFVKKHDRTKNIPVIMLSGKDGVFDKMRGKLNGCDGFLAKPFESKDLLEIVRENLVSVNT